MTRKLEAHAAHAIAALIGSLAVVLVAFIGTLTLAGTAQSLAAGAFIGALPAAVLTNEITHRALTLRAEARMRQHRADAQQAYTNAATAERIAA